MVLSHAGNICHFDQMMIEHNTHWKLLFSHSTVDLHVWSDIVVSFHSGGVGHDDHDGLDDRNSHDDHDGHDDADHTTFFLNPDGEDQCKMILSTLIVVCSDYVWCHSCHYLMNVFCDYHHAHFCSVSSSLNFS